MPQSVLIIIVCAAMLGLLLLWRGLHNFFTGHIKRGRGLAQLLLAFIFFTIASGLGFLMVCLSVYAPYIKDKNIASITFEREKAEQTYTAFLDWDDGLSKRYVIKGEQFEISARVIKWKDFASDRLGLTPVYQFDRLEGRYDDIDQEKYGEKTIYDLTENKGVDIWELLEKNKEKLPFTDTGYGTATYLPIDTKLTYDIYLSSTGLYARVRD